MMNENLKAHIYVVVAAILIAGSFLASKQLSGVLHPISLTLYRFVVAMGLLLPFLLFKKDVIKRVLKVLPKAMVVSLFYALYFIGMFKALESTTVLNTGIIYTLVPLMTAILCIFFFKEYIALGQFFIYLLGIVATIIVVFRADVGLLLSFSLHSGDIIFFLASLSMSLYPIFLKILYDKKEDIIILVFSTLLGGSLWMFLAMLVLDIPFEWQKIDKELLYAMLYLVVATTIFTLFLYQKATLILGPKKVMAYVYINPALVAIIAFLFHGEVVSFGVLSGIVISSFATFMILKQSHTK
ncbi:MAG: DMT family transporter [Sulfurimonadaceae bacterium]|jgi:drug/metabolite transporter (DMT)-like permease|nr:DMT family transporter [Sulfurimonadaceae bacterium]